MPTCVVAEDEELLRTALLGMLAEAWPDLDVVAACDDGGSALDAIAEAQPDIAFLDIRMPGLTGLEVAAATAQASPKTQVVFVTAYNQYAIDAFERGAVDYLLKPITRERLDATIQRLKARTSTAPNSGALEELVEKLRGSIPASRPAQPLAWITASAGKETRLIMVEDIVYFQADNKYTVVMTKDGESLVRTPIRELLDVLDPVMFKQIHRSTIVNMRAISSVTRDESGRGTLKLRGRAEALPVSLTYMSLFRNM
ncbi:LytR/AlgR family response regulator transcription factor [Usitatibacter palustris]|uniref:Transcriptional regulatory protein YpdB n=1 Tax=Usitatibacter palustris TaxID=2732487 RepID=A0A6M4HBL4_9PROT|nr:LytTR family DNA-binding domain-containing protein [Usitatibacter palustris]QJR15874.1 Transcriptional regulatory protein YpdB [Usitatibacter palustris]